MAPPAVPVPKATAPFGEELPAPWAPSRDRRTEWASQMVDGFNCLIVSFEAVS